VESAVLALSGAVEGTLVPEGVPTCTTNTATLYGDIGGEKYSLTVFAPFANYPGGQTITLPPPPQIDAGLKLTGVRAGPWVGGPVGRLRRDHHWPRPPLGIVRRRPRRPGRQ
jgi:hypothetical protein